MQADIPDSANDKRESKRSGNVRPAMDDRFSAKKWLRLLESGTVASGIEGTVRSGKRDGRRREPIRKGIPRVRILPVVLVLCLAVAGLLIPTGGGSAQRMGRDGHPVAADVGRLVSSSPLASSSPGQVDWSLCLNSGDLLEGTNVNNQGTYPYSCGYDIYGSTLEPDGIVWDPSNGNLYEVNINGPNVFVINGTTNELAEIIGCSGWGGDIVYDSANGMLFYTGQNGNHVYVIDGANNTWIDTIAIGSGDSTAAGYHGLAYDSANGDLYVADSTYDNVSVIDGSTDKTIASIPLAPNSSPAYVAYDPANGYLYVSLGGSNAVAIIDGATNTLLGQISVGLYPTGVVYDPNSGIIYVANSGNDNVTGINGATNTVQFPSIPVGKVPLGMAYDNANGLVYVADSDDTTTDLNNVSAFNGTTGTFVGNVFWNGWFVPQDMTYDGSNGYLYVTDQTDVDVVQTLVPGAQYNLTFVESGLPTGTLWNVTLTGSHTSYSLSSNTPTLAYQEPNGTFSYAVGGASGYTPSPSSGTVTVRGNAMVVSLTFAPTTYPVTFGETGLPSGTSWSVSLNGTSVSSATPQVAFTEPNGTYTFNVGVVSGYTPSPSSGGVTVSGAGATVPITFVPTTYSVAFTESGLSVGTNWSVTLNGQVQAVTGNTILFTEPNGTYAYSVGGVSGYSATPSSGNVAVNGASQNIAITFTPVTVPTYPVTFTESGLAGGTGWSVTVSGKTQSSTTSAITFTEANGTYAFTVASVSGYSSSPASGSVTVKGAPQTVSVVFTPSTPTTYPVTFSESGLPGGTSWSVTLNTQTISSTATSMTHNEANGTYSFTVGAMAGYTTSPSSGTITVNGGAVSQAITFSPIPPSQFQIAITETGLPAGTNWSVTLNGQPLSSLGHTLIFTVPNGTYAYTVGSVS
ncbi:MAG: hypothetical protein JRN35_08665, partial [Nitrososphaerota archaeon]|nr:hypothetical protein [Nitrososphaerota archaeon]